MTFQDVVAVGERMVLSERGREDLVVADASLLPMATAHHSVL